MERLGATLGSNVNTYLTPAATALGAAAAVPLRPPSSALGAALGAAAASPAASLGSTLGAAVALPPAALPALADRAAPLGLRTAQAISSSHPVASFFARHMPVRQAGSNLADAMRSTLGGGYDSIASLFGFGSFAGGIAGQVGAPFSPTGPGFAGGMLDSAAPFINASAAKWGIPANFLAAVIARESTGNWQRDGNRYVYLPPRGHNVLPYVGMTDPAVRQYGTDPRSLIGDQAGQIDVLARQLRRLYDDYGNWEAVANVHYSGDPTGKFTPGDSWQYGSTNQSTNMIMNFWRRLEPGFNPNAGVAGAAASMGASAGNAIGTMLGGSSPRISQEFGLTEFSKGHLGGMYSYATNYGVQGHAGLDISLNPGTTLYSPVSGTVVYGGGTNFYTDERYGKGVPGTGELRLKLDNGDEVILGNMEPISVRPGQRVSAGQAVGRS